MSNKPFRTAILHVGGDKTGSTSIQTACDYNREKLYELGIYYPEGQWHAMFGSYFCEYPEHYIYNQLLRLKDHDFLLRRDFEYLQNLRNELSDKSGKYLVFSYEGFLSLDEIALKRLKSFILEYADECKIFYYVRSPESYAVSAMSQRVKMGFFSWLENTLPVQPYVEIFSRIIHIFDKENCIVRLFDRKALIGGDVIVDFLSQLDVSSEILYKMAESLKIENTSLSLEGLVIGDKVINALADHNLCSNLFYGKFGSIFEKIKGQKIQLTQYQADSIAEVSKIHVEYLKTEFGIIFPASSQQYPESIDSTLSDETAESIAQLIVELVASELMKKESRAFCSEEFQLHHAVLKEDCNIIHGQTMCFEVEFALDREISELEAGIHILDTQKRWAFGVNSTLQKHVIRDVVPGVYRISHYVVADLPEGVYTVGFAFAEKFSDGSINELMWYDKLCEFRVSHPSDRIGVGYVNLPSTQMLTKISDIQKITNGAGKMVPVSVPTNMKPLEANVINVKIHNDTDVTWRNDPSRPINLSYHWLDENGTVILFEGERTPLPDAGVLAYDSTLASMKIVAPKEEGKYKLILTMVQELVAWFENIGFESYNVMIEIKN